MNMLLKSRWAFVPRLAASVSILAALASTSLLQAGNYTWSGPGTQMNTGSNWSPSGPPVAEGDSAIWNGSVAGPLSLTWTDNWTLFSSNNPGVAILVKSTQTSSLTMTGTASGGTLQNGNIGFHSFEVENGAGPVSVGVGTGSFQMVYRGYTSGTSNYLTNNSSNTVTFGSNITGWSNGGGGDAGVHNVLFTGSGNWQIDAEFAPGASASGDNTLTKEGTGTLTFSGSQNGLRTGSAATSLKTITINEGTVKFAAAAQITTALASLGTYTSAITNNGTFEWDSSATQTLSGVISGTGALRQTGTGLLRLSGATANTYSGLTTITAGEMNLNKTAGRDAIAGNIAVDGGTLKLLANNQIKNTSTVGVSSGTFNLQGFDETVAGVQITGGSIVSSTGTLTSTTAYDVQAGSVSARLAGSVGLNKTSAGTATLSGANLYTGATVVSAGTLVLGTGGSVATSTSVDLNAGATFDTTAQSFTMLSGQTFNFTLDGTGPGSAGLLSAATLNIDDGVVTFSILGPLNDSVYILANYSSLAGINQTFASVTAPDGYTINYNYLGGNQIALEAIPEPNAVGLFLGGLGLIAIFRRRRA